MNAISFLEHQISVLQHSCLQHKMQSEGKIVVSNSDEKKLLEYLLHRTEKKTFAENSRSLGRSSRVEARAQNVRAHGVEDIKEGPS